MYLSIGSLTIQKQWVAVLLAMLLIELLLLIWRRKVESDVYSSAMIVFILTWKLSIIIFQLPFVIKNPLSIVYFDGGIKGYYLAIILVLTYLAFQVKKRAIVQIDWVIFLALLTFNLYEIVLHILLVEQLWIKLLTVIINLIFLIVLLIVGRKDIWNVQLAVLFPIVQLLLYSIHNETFTSICTYMFFIVGLLIMKKRWK